jgi:hypothetical protein
MSATNCCGVTPAFSAAIMIGAPWASSAQTKSTRMALHALETHPDVGLDVLHDVADVKIAIGVRQSGGDKELALGHGRSRVGQGLLAGPGIIATGIRPGFTRLRPEPPGYRAAALAPVSVSAISPAGCWAAQNFFFDSISWTSGTCIKAAEP